MRPDSVQIIDTVAGLIGGQETAEFDTGQAAELALYELWQRREQGPIPLMLGPEYMSYRPGDTLTLDGHRIRLAGMDTPEMMQVCKRDGADWRCGVAARSRLAELLRAGPVTCRTQGTDKYDRWLARCETGAGDLGARMVREGLAVAYGDYEDEERFARAERKGLWGTEFDMPQQWRRMNGRPQEDTHKAEPGMLGSVFDALGFS